MVHACIYYNYYYYDYDDNDYYYCLADSSVATNKPTRIIVFT